MNKPVFFSDLDRTLIFSKKFLLEEIESVVIEKKKDKEISYMTKEALSLLYQVKNEFLFVPVSTRTWDEMLRIDFIRNDIPMLMVCDNGAHIYKDGEKIKEWEEIILNEKRKRKISAHSFEKSIKAIFVDRGLKEVINHDNLYLVLKFEEMTGEIRQTLEVLHLAFIKKGYRIDVNSRKAYILPEYVTKEKAVQFLISNYQLNKTISAGDSFMDFGMLKSTTYAIAPKHKTFLENVMKVTNQEGIKAGEEILHMVQHLLRYTD